MGFEDVVKALANIILYNINTLSFVWFHNLKENGDKNPSGYSYGIPNLLLKQVNLHIRVTLLKERLNTIKIKFELPWLVQSVSLEWLVLYTAPLDNV